MLYFDLPSNFTSIYLLLFSRVSLFIYKCLARGFKPKLLLYQFHGPRAVNSCTFDPVTPEEILTIVKTFGSKKRNVDEIQLSAHLKLSNSDDFAISVFFVYPLRRRMSVFILMFSR